MEISHYTHNDWNRESEFTLFHLELEYYDKYYRLCFVFLGIGFGINLKKSNPSIK